MSGLVSELVVYHTVSLRTMTIKEETQDDLRFARVFHVFDVAVRHCILHLREDEMNRRRRVVEIEGGSKMMFGECYDACWRSKGILVMLSG